MESVIPFGQGLSLRISDTAPPERRFPTGRLARGLLLQSDGDDLAEEAVGFGVPVVKRGLVTIFPGSVALDVNQTAGETIITAHFDLNLVERFSRPVNGTLENLRFYDFKNFLSATMRHVPVSRWPLTLLSSQLRKRFNWETAYADSLFRTEVVVTFTVGAQTGVIGVELDTSGLHPAITELVLMHEHGADAFDVFRDASGRLERGDRIGLWDEVRASEAWFESSTHRVAFKVKQLDGARLYRGRELIDGRLAWAGFGYSFRPPVPRSRHNVLITRLA